MKYKIYREDRKRIMVDETDDWHDHGYGINYVVKVKLTLSGSYTVSRMVPYQKIIKIDKELGS